MHIEALRLRRALLFGGQLAAALPSLRTEFKETAATAATREAVRVHEEPPVRPEMPAGGTLHSWRPLSTEVPREGRPAWLGSACTCSLTSSQEWGRQLE